MESPNHLIIVRGDVATATSRTTSLVGRGITALNEQRQAAILAKAHHSRYETARAIFDRQCDNTSKTVFTEDEAQALYTTYLTLRELADAGYLRACYPVSHFLREGWRILPREEATRDMLAADRAERIRRYVMNHALGVYQEHDLPTLVAEKPVDLVSVIEWCAEHCPAAIQASKAPAECLPLRDFEVSLTYENLALAGLKLARLNAPEWPDGNEAMCDLRAIRRRRYSAKDVKGAFECVPNVDDDSAMSIFDADEDCEFGYSEWAANNGYARAQCDLGLMYAYGGGDVERDEAKAMRWLRRSADQGNSLAQWTLGLEIFCSSSFDHSEDGCVEVVRWCRLSAEQGNARAQDLHGFMYEGGIGVDEDKAEAVRWYRLSAAQGCKEGLVSLGMAHRGGHGVARDDAEAVRCFQLGADQGSSQAQCKLARMYEEGRGVERNLDQAVFWYQKAADQKHRWAVRRLNELLTAGTA